MRSLMALLLASVAVVVGAAAVPAATQSGIRGTVIRSPTKPVCEEGVTCSAPAAGVALLATRNGIVVARVTTAHDGTFRVALRPDTYIVRIAGKLPFGGSPPQTVRVRQGRFAVVRLTIDTGIR